MAVFQNTKISLFSTNVSVHRVLSTLQPSGVINTVPPDRGKLVTVNAGSSKRQSLLITGDRFNAVFKTRSLSVTPKTRYQIVCICKSEAEVTNNKRLCSRYCTIEANY